MGYRAMRHAFFELELEEIFENAKKGDARCREFVDLWHRALAAATASFIHLAGPGGFNFTGKNVGFVDLPLLRSSNTYRLRNGRRKKPFGIAGACRSTGW